MRSDAKQHGAGKATRKGTWARACGCAVHTGGLRGVLAHPARGSAQRAARHVRGHSPDDRRFRPYVKRQHWDTLPHAPVGVKNHQCGGAGLSPQYFAQTPNAVTYHEPTAM